MALVIIKNTTGVAKNWGGRRYDASSSYTIEEVDRLRLLSDSVFLADLISAAAVINNGSVDVSAAIGLLRLRGVANEYWFDNSSNGFSATHLQTAIEEAKNTAILKPRYSIVTNFNGTVGNNNWLGYSELIPGNEVPIRIPMNSKLKEITVAYKNTELSGIPTGSNLIDGRLQVFKNGLTDPTNIAHTETFTNQASGKVISGLDISFAANDYLVSRWKDDGDNPSDMAIVYFFQVE